MPVLKIPIVHKFGIISHSQRLELQERLLRQTYQKENAAAIQLSRHIRANPLEACEKFVQQYNTLGIEQQDKAKAEAERMLIHSKRRAGMLTQGEGDYVDLPMAWSELAILAQCKGKLQEDCFEILCTSLQHAPLHEDNIPTLFFLAESTLYWLKTDSINQPYLRTAEIRLLRMGYLVFARLYYYHIVGQLKGLEEFKSRLSTYLEGIHEHQTLYKSYPGVWISLQFIAQVGHVIVNPPNSPLKNQENEQAAEVVIQPTAVALSPILHQALQVWWCTKGKKTGLKQAILEMLMNNKDLGKENWINSIIILSILGEAAKLNASACRCLQDVARGICLSVEMVATLNLPDAPQYAHRTGATDVPEQDRKNTKTKNDNEAIGQGSAFQKIMSDMMSDFDSAIGKNSTGQETKDIGTLAKNDNTSSMISSKIRSLSESKERKEQVPNSSRKTPRTVTDQPWTASAAPTPCSANDLMNKDILAGISTWRWETAYQYSQILTDISLHGSTSTIQKMAVMGKWLDADVTTFRAGIPNFCIESCGLVDLLEFSKTESDPDTVTNAKSQTPSSQIGDWTWRIRYGALSGLLHLTHALQKNDLKEGMRSAAWSLIVAIQNSANTEEKVLEAIRVGQVEYPDSNEDTNDDTSESIWSRIAQGFTERFIVSTLPIPASPSSRAQPASTSPRAKLSTRQAMANVVTPVPIPTRERTYATPRKLSPDKTTLKDNLLLHTSTKFPSSDLTLRNNLNLQRIVEDQWRKQLMKEQEHEEKQMLKEIQNKREEEERQLRETLQKREQKLEGRPTQHLAPYEI